MTTRIGVCGAAGRMGQTILHICNEDQSVEVTAATEYQHATTIGIDAGEHAGIGKIGIKIADDLTKVIDQVDVFIDFTTAHALPQNLEKCRVAGKPMVIGTTGLSDSQQQLIRHAAQDIPIVFAANMSIGINLCLKLLETTAQVLGKSADVEIMEIHHKHKKDAPSGTALRMGEVIADTLGLDLQECAVYNRQGITDERKENSIGFSSIRAGDIIGEHTVIFTLAGERIEISHKSTSRRNFALGAVRAAQWVKNQTEGLFDMQDVLYR